MVIVFRSRRSQYSPGMIPRYRPLALYSLLLATATGAWLAWELGQAAGFPPLWVAALCVLFNLFVFQFGIPTPWVGLTSLERLPQAGLLLVFSPPVAALICATASLLWPLLNRGYLGDRSAARARGRRGRPAERPALGSERVLER